MLAGRGGRGRGGRERPGAARRELEHARVVGAQARAVPHAEAGHARGRERAVEALLRGEVQRGGGLVQDGQPRAREQQPGEGQALLLPQ